MLLFFAALTVLFASNAYVCFRAIEIDVPHWVGFVFGANVLLAVASALGLIVFFGLALV